MLQVLRFAREKVIFAPHLKLLMRWVFHLPSIRKAITSLEEFGILVEITKQKEKSLCGVIVSMYNV